MKEKMLSKAFKRMILNGAKLRNEKNGSNVKLGNMLTWSTLPGDCDYYVPELDMMVHGTCGRFCKGCFNGECPSKSACYVFKAIARHTYRNEDGSVGDLLWNRCTVKTGHAYRTLAMTLYRDELFDKLDGQISRMKVKPDYCRINQSGELTGYPEFKCWCELARKHKDITFYIYTKNYPAIRKGIKNDVIPKNLFVNISVWHKSGLEAYKEMAWHSQIRCFALVDKDWTAFKYEVKGIKLDAMCPAYDSKGKMNHNVTCSTCGLCASGKKKALGCYEH